MIIESAIAAYATVISTASFVLAIKVYRAGNPKVEVDWVYNEPDRNLTLSILNLGRGDVTISVIDLYIAHEEITSRSRNGKYFNIKFETIDCISRKDWCIKSKGIGLPARLVSHSMLSVQVKNDAIVLDPKYPLDELLLKFVAKFPGGKAVAYLRGDVLRHFVGINPDVPISFPSPGSLPLLD